MVEYTIVTEYSNEKKVMKNKLYLGKEVAEQNEITILSKKTLNEKILEVMNSQEKRLENNPELNRIVEAIRI